MPSVMAHGVWWKRGGRGLAVWTAAAAMIVGPSNDARARSPRDELTAQLTRLAEALGVRGKVRVVSVSEGVIEAEIITGGVEDETASEFTELMAKPIGPERYHAATEGQAALAAEENRWELTSCANPDGATIDVPFGSFSGSELVGVTDEDRPVKNDFTGEVLRNMSRRFVLGQLGQRSNTSGWDFEPGAMLYSVVSPMVGKDVLNGSDPTDPELWTTCEAVQRFIYVGPSGSFTFEAAKPDIVYVDELPAPDASVCWTNLRNGFFDGATYYSTDGHARLDGDRIAFSDGHVEVFRGSGSGRAFEPFNAGLIDHIGSPVLPEYMRYVASLVVLDRAIDANGNVVQYEYGANDWVSAVVDPDGLRTEYLRDARGRVEEIRTPGIGGGTDVYDLVWQTRTFDPAVAFPDALAMNSNGHSVIANRQEYTTLAALVIPDGRRWRFEYGAWGNPTRVFRPSGAVVEYEYGDASTFSHLPPGRRTCPNAWDALRKRRIVGERVYPVGLDVPDGVRTTAFEHEPVTTETNVPATPGPNFCSAILWYRRIQGEGPTRRIIREGRCGSQNLWGLDGRTLVQEVRDADDRVVEATYFGDPQTGELFVEFELSIGYHSQGTAFLGADSTMLDVRHTRIDHLRDGVRWSETFVYDRDVVEATTLDGEIVKRSRGNLVEHTVLGPEGEPLLVERNTYETAEAYLARNLVRLAKTAVVEDGQGNILAKAETIYDQDGESDLVASGIAAPRRVAVGDARGNPTSSKAWVDDDHAIATRSVYYDNGAVAQLAGPRSGGDLDAGFTTTTTHDFASCSDTHPVTETRVTSPVPGNGAELPHVVVTRSDCWTGATLSVTAPDGGLTCMRFDALGRVIEEAGPGDALTRDAPGISDPACASDRDVGPTATNHYELAITGEGQSDPAAAFVRTTRKNGAAGVRSLAFADGLGRTVATCSEVDPTEADGNTASCVVTTHDFRDLALRTTAPFWLPDLPERAPTAPASTPTIVREYDVLGRETSVELEGSPLGPMLTTYESDGSGAWLTTVLDRNGYTTVTKTDVLGHVVRIDREWADVEGGTSTPCSAGTCSQQLTYDALGRLLAVTEDNEQTAVTRHGYDWLGRRIWTVDADMGGFARAADADDDDATGRWHFVYDDAGNEVQRTDAAGHEIAFEYDALDRVVRKTMPSATADDDDETTVTWFYDGAGPGVPQ